MSVGLHPQAAAVDGQCGTRHLRYKTNLEHGSLLIRARHVPIISLTWKADDFPKHMLMVLPDVEHLDWFLIVSDIYAVHVVQTSSSVLQGESVWAKSGRNCFRSSGQVFFLRYFKYAVLLVSGQAFNRSLWAKVVNKSVRGFKPILVSEIRKLFWPC